MDGASKDTQSPSFTLLLLLLLVRSKTTGHRQKNTFLTFLNFSEPTNGVKFHTGFSQKLEHVLNTFFWLKTGKKQSLIIFKGLGL